MGRWKPNPNEDIGRGESLGRRLFARASLAGATDQRPLPSVDLRNFEDSRGEISLDRLGQGNPEKAVLRYLNPRADAAAKNLGSSKMFFNGWAYVQAKVLLDSKKLPIAIVPSPIPGNSPSQEDDLTENIYHAHTRSLRDTEPYFMALHLQDQFEKHGRIEYSQNDPRRPPDPNWIGRQLLSLGNLLRRLADKFEEMGERSS